MTEKLDILGFTAAHFDTRLLDSKTDGNDSMQQSYDEICNVLELMGVRDDYPVFKGMVECLKDEKTPEYSDAGKFIAEQALKMRGGDEKLFVVVQGSISNVADALLMHPEIETKMVVIWIGGGAYPEGFWEFNLNGDLNASNVVFDSNVEIACGEMVGSALAAAQLLGKDGLSATMLDMYCIKPLGTKAVIKAAENSCTVVVIEEHSIFDGWETR